MTAAGRKSDEVAAEEAFLAVEREVAVLFRRGRARTAEMSRRVHPALEGVAYSLLGHIEETGPVRLTDIGLHFGVGKPTISRQIKALEGLGLVVREVDPLDRRSSLVSLTADGAERYRRAREGRMARFRALMATWQTVDVERFAELLERFNELTGEVDVRRLDGS
ncbi:MarR family transcriptional regulator [Kitasatospora sp. MMS16-BH015]|uniref:MarR family winged helix-turn-helix transcriptional regulator n=1 Tax=Kitasatospora sp. MMS16-BH015 TaxID=2018025 RepID=UPI000CA34C96|nr:MarR family transcriptional regulator [Kitasatospora sp. MMS16-BH015]AUG79650.1 MarR family transcriptional regulator [Kitasatospora sp. MMS16-BH015]